ncbi:MAG: M23 family metallopeptidase [Thermoleophilia bacterium]|nr:M23 family metallopeptidase [Thermoleophilia bacterium]
MTVRNVSPARYFPGTDNRNHVEYNLVITNGLQTEAKLKSLVVRSGRRTVLELSGNALAGITHPLSLGILKPTSTIPSASSVASLIDVKLPGSSRNFPGRLTSTVRYAVTSGPLSNIVDNHKVTLGTQVDGRPPIVIAPPLRGSGWFGGNACCDPNGSHRSGLLAIDNRLTMIEAFAIDYSRIVNGSLIKGDGSKLTDFYGYGEPIHSVANGKVVAVHKGMPDAPWPPGPPNPTVQTSADYTGNSAIVKIGPHQFALYAHMLPGSIRVRKGQSLRTGQKIGRLGNSGNSFGPHLHFAVQSRPYPFARSVPYVFDRFKFEGIGTLDPADTGRVEIKGPSRRERRVYPLAGAVATFER